jgi:hypothetical protein
MQKLMGRTPYDLTDEQFSIIVSDPEIEVIEHSVKDVNENAAAHS